MYDIYLLQYNNYYNRIVKFESELSDYRNASTVTPYILNNVNFNTADGINTELVVNIQDERSIEMFDYALVYDSNDNLTRWFIIDANRLRNGQWKISLRRDVIVDNYSNVINAPTFIEKATLSDLDPLIFNSENMTYNQIKQSETLIKDETESAWIVGYVSRGDRVEETITIPASTSSYDMTVSITDTLFTQYGVVKNDVCFEFYHDAPGNVTSIFRYYPASDKLYLSQLTLTYATEFRETTLRAELTANEITTLLNLSSSYFSTDNAYDFDYDTRLEYNNKRTYDNGQIYQITTSVVNSKIESNTISASTNIGVILKKLIRNNTPYQIKASYTKYNKLNTYVDVTASVLTYTMSSDRTSLEDAPYDMFAIPMSIPYAIYINSQQVMSGSSELNRKQISLNVAQVIYQKLGSKCYDVQIVPYCPLTCRQLATTTRYTFYDLTSRDYELVKDNNQTTQAIIFWCSKSKFSRTVYQEVIIPNDSLKVMSETTMLRLVSPNYNGIFEYNPFKLKQFSNFSIDEHNNRIYVGDYWNIDCDYKPGMPYIHIAPNFGYLYGQDYDDARGLICGGDFSISRVDDAWVNYVNNNKNYQKTFDRQIESVEFNNRWNIAEGAVNAVGGVVQGSAMGAVAGGPYGAIAGAVVGTAQGALNITETIARQKETLDYTKDQFGYSLGNIKALPQSLSQVSSMNNNNKIFPFVEFYTCTDREKEALKNKLYYNGMTVGVIGRITDYQQEQKTYIKGKLIRLTGVDFHEVAVIAEEIDKGVFI